MKNKKFKIGLRVKWGEDPNPFRGKILSMNNHMVEILPIDPRASSKFSLFVPYEELKIDTDTLPVDQSIVNAVKEIMKDENIEDKQTQTLTPATTEVSEGERTDLRSTNVDTDDGDDQQDSSS